MCLFPRRRRLFVCVKVSFWRSQVEANLGRREVRFVTGGVLDAGDPDHTLPRNDSFFTHYLFFVTRD